MLKLYLILHTHASILLVFSYLLATSYHHVVYYIIKCVLYEYGLVDTSGIIYKL